MTNNFSSAVGAQIRLLITGISRKAVNQTIVELRSLVDAYGNDALLFLLRILFASIELKPPKFQSKENQARLQVLTQELTSVLARPNFVSLVCQALEGQEIVQPDLLGLLTKQLKLNVSMQMTLAVALANSGDLGVSREGIAYLKAHMREFAESKEKPPPHVAHGLFYVVKTRAQDFVEVVQFVEALRSYYSLTDADVAIAPLFLTETAVLCVDAKWRYQDEREQQGDDQSLVERINAACPVADLMEDLGPGCTSQPTSLRDVLEQFPATKEPQIARIVGMMARTQDVLPPRDAWNTDVFVDVVRGMYPSLSWPTVIRFLDYTGFAVHGLRGVALIMSIFNKASGEPFPVDSLVGRKWTNTAGQLSFLQFALLSPPDVFSLAVLPHRAVDAPAGRIGGPPGSHNWVSLDVLELLLGLAVTEFNSVVRAMLEQPLSSCPDLLLCGIAQLKNNWNPLAVEIIDLLLPRYLSAFPASTPLLQKVWQLDAPIVTRALIMAYTADAAVTSRLCDIAVDIRALPQLLEARPYTFAVDIAVQAARRQVLDFEHWLNDRVRDQRDAWLRACSTLLRDRLRDPPTTAAAVQAGLLPPDVVSVMTRVLSGYASQASRDLQDEVQQAVALASRALGMQGGIPAAAAAVGPGSGQQEVFTKEIEDEANQQFQDLFNGGITIEELVHKLKTYMESRDGNQHKVYTCIIRTLIDECRFFHKYPDKELRICGILFGSLIQHQLVQGIWLGLALRYVLDSLKKSANSKMFRFGLFALEQFKSRLYELPQYCSYLEKIEHLKTSPVGGEVLEIARQVAERGGASGVGASETPIADGSQTRGASDGHSSLVQTTPLVGTAPLQPGAVGQPQQAPGTPERSAAPPAAQRTPSKPTGRVEGGGSGGFATSLNIDTLVTAFPQETVMPDESVQDRVHFIFNNLSTSNLEAKSTEMKALVAQQFYPFLAQYIVVRRASQESNFHNLYLQFVSTFNVPIFNQVLLSATYAGIRALLRSDRTRSSTSERTLLKNLGSWLGLITIARNKPILLNDLDLKELILDAYEHGRLIAVIPFVCKVLDACRLSKVVRPPNPWVMGLLGVLAELYAIPDLKTNLKFEVIALCKTLTIDLAELKPSTLLRDRLVDKNDNPDFRGEDSSTAVPPSAAAAAAAIVGVDSMITPTGAMGIPPSPLRTAQPAPPGHIPPLMQGASMTDKMQTPTSALGGITPGTTASGAVAGATVDPFSLVAAVAAASNIAFGVTSPVELFTMFPNLKRVVPAAVTRSISEHYSTVVDRSVNIACVTTRVLVLKDFAFEPDENKMIAAAHTMVRSLACGFAVVNFKELLRATLTTHARSMLLQSLPDPSQPQVQALVETAVAAVVNDNLDAACLLIERAATEKALRDIDDALLPTLQARRRTKHFDGGQGGAGSQGLSAVQLRVYDDFAQLRRGDGATSPNMMDGGKQQGSLPGVLGAPSVPPSAAAAATAAPGAPGTVWPRAMPSQEMEPAPQEIFEKLKGVLDQLDAALSSPLGATTLSALPAESDVRLLVIAIQGILLLAPSRPEVVLLFAQRVHSMLSSKPLPLHLDVLVIVLESVRDVCGRLPRELTIWLLTSEDDRVRYNPVLFAAYMRAQLLVLSELDGFLTKQVDGGRNSKALDFCVQLLRRALLQEQSCVPADLPQLIDTISKIAARGAKAAGETVFKLADELRTAAADIDRRGRRVRSVADLGVADGDPAGLRAQITALFADWAKVLRTGATAPGGLEAAMSQYLLRLQQAGVLKGEDIMGRSFRLMVELCVERAYAEQGQPQGTQQPLQGSQDNMEAYARLVSILVRSAQDSFALRLAVMQRAMHAVARVLVRDHDARGSRFSQRPFTRLYLALATDLLAVDEQALPLMLQQFTNSLMVVQPLRAPGFAFAWLELCSHRLILPRLLQNKVKGWPQLQRLLVVLLQFLEPPLRSVTLSEPIQLLYKGLLRVLLVILHDFPEFLCEYHFSFCDVVPPSCIQLRNLILSAFPRNMRLPDPFTPHLKVDLLPEIQLMPVISANYTVALGNLRADLDGYLRARQPSTLLTDLAPRLLLPPAEAVRAGTKYNVPAINALVLYVGMQAVTHIQNKAAPSGSLTTSGCMDIFLALASDLDAEGRFYFLNAVANNLRYPNSHTHYFSWVLLYMFAEAKQELVQEQITRVLLERLIANRPHPWGLLITFIELIKNPRYNFWSHRFTRCATEIERLFEHVARNCIGAPMSAGGVDVQHGVDVSGM